MPFEITGSRNTNHPNVSKRKPKRPREAEDKEREFLCNVDSQKANEFIHKCRKAQVTGNTRELNKCCYVEHHQQPETLQWLLDDPCTLMEVEYWDQNGPTGQMTGMIRSDWFM